MEGFKRYRDVSPMKLLKLTRLDYVHLALKEADAQVDRTWFEMARIRFLESLGQDGLAGARDWILASLQVRCNALGLHLQKHIA